MAKKQVIKTVSSGGYDKLSVMSYIDRLNGELQDAQNGEQRKKHLAPPERVLREAKFGGFDKKDVEEYVNAVNEKIKSSGGNGQN